MDAILDKSAFARIRLQPAVAAAVSSGVASGRTVLRSLLVQRTEICVSARNAAGCSRTGAADPVGRAWGSVE